MLIPQKLLYRKDEITSSFLTLLEEHIKDILDGRVDYVYHIKDFAAKLNIHSSHFSSIVKLVTGKSPSDFIEQRLMREAKKLLCETTLSISDICYRLNFNEPTNFTKFFKAMTGITPRQYRMEMAEAEILTIK
ncbi:helix-turn-helix domain-containing protein [Chitinophagaceae bacterium MMS25-I14]